MLCKAFSVLCVLEQSRVDNSSMGPNWRKANPALGDRYSLPTLPPDLHTLYRGTIQGPLYVELVLQNYIQ